MDPYDALGLESGAAEGDIKKAYRKMSLKYHPDKVSLDMASVDDECIQADPRTLRPREVRIFLVFGLFRELIRPSDHVQEDLSRPVHPDRLGEADVHRYPSRG